MQGAEIGNLRERQHGAMPRDEQSGILFSNGKKVRQDTWQAGEEASFRALKTHFSIQTHSSFFIMLTLSFQLKQ
jgi:hypothetical protein